RVPLLSNRKRDGCGRLSGIRHLAAPADPALTRIVYRQRNRFVALFGPLDGHADTRRDRRRQILAYGVGEVHLIRASRWIEHHLVVEIAFHHHDAAVVRIVIAMRNGARSGRRGRGRHRSVGRLRAAGAERGDYRDPTGVQAYAVPRSATKARKHETKISTEQCSLVLS